ncbi:hypothetical protein MSP8886_01477 [Marinomonas spartinae]|uniref:Uncharacterized protein n=1 Tax=Marinomonas spartinae TaxID=1792290 RepID=A0A1A8T9Q5_9GAMM|nr:hypothetical protein MSP8886_01477 [Marinomonas spartinae]
MDGCLNWLFSIFEKRHNEFDRNTKFDFVFLFLEEDKAIIPIERNKIIGFDISK